MFGSGNDREHVFINKTKNEKEFYKQNTKHISAPKSKTIKKEKKINIDQKFIVFESNEQTKEKLRDKE